MESQLQEVGRSIHAAFPGKSRHPLRALDERAMELASHDAELRAALFRFVDVTPACRSLDDLARHLAGYLEEVDERPPPIEAAMRMSGTKAGRAALGAAAAAGVRHMAHRFIVGETPKAALKTIRHLWENGAAVSLDLLGEATVTEAEADRYAARCLDALETLAGAAGSWPERPVLEADSLGRLPRVNLSVKVSALTPLLRPEAPEVGREDAARRMRPLLVRAARARSSPAHRHGVGGHDRGHARAGVRAARRAGAARWAVRGRRDAGLPARVARAARAGDRVGDVPARASSRSWCAS